MDDARPRKQIADNSSLKKPGRRPPWKRSWAGGKDLEFSEGIAALYLETSRLTGYAAVRSAVVDANVIFGHLIGCVRGDCWTPLFAAAEGGLLRLFVAQQAADEVSEHLEEVAERRRCDPETLAAWWARARHLLRVVAVTVSSEPDYESLRRRDPDDLPTAILARIVGTRLTWSSDRALQETGFAVRYDGRIVRAITNVVTLDVSGHFWLSLTTAAVESAVPAAIRLVRRSGQIGVVIGAGAAFLTAGLAIYMARNPDTRAGLRTRAATAGGAISRGIAALVDYRRQLIAQVPPAPAIDLSLPDDLAIARTLAFAPTPLYEDEIDRMTPGDLGASRIQAAVSASTLFVMGRTSAYQLGDW